MFGAMKTVSVKSD